MRILLWSVFVVAGSYLCLMGFGVVPPEGNLNIILALAAAVACLALLLFHTPLFGKK